MSLERLIVCDGCGRVGARCNGRPNHKARRELAEKHGWTFPYVSSVGMDYCGRCTKRLEAARDQRKAVVDP